MASLIRRNGRDLVELIIVPALAIFLPWLWCFGLFRLLARWPWFYAQETQAMLSGANSLGFAEPAVAKEWCNRFRLLRLVDHADLYLSWVRSDHWMDRFMSIKGNSWPLEAKPFLAISFHWGAGLWAFRHLRREGVDAAALFRNLEQADLKGLFVRKWYYRRRIREVERCGNAAPIFTGGVNSRRLLTRLNEGCSVVALVDVPPTPGTRCLPVQLLGQEARFPRGLVRLAVSKQIPVVGFALGMDHKTGRRELIIKGPLPSTDEQSLMNALAALFNDCLARDPVAWHFWPYVAMFLGASGDTIQPEPNL